MLKFILLLIPFLLIAQDQPIKSPEEIQAELDQAEAQFRKAEKMFNPWYTGPLIASSASMVPPGDSLFFDLLDRWLFRSTFLCSSPVAQRNRAELIKM